MANLVSRTAGSSVPRKDEITTAARSLLEEEGPQALTMRRLASRLGIQAPSLYKHVGGKGELEAALAALALEEIADVLADVGSLEELGRAYRDFALAHPHLYRFATERPLPRDRLPEGLEARAAAPVERAAGGDPDRARAVLAFAHGMVELELAGRFPPDADLDAAWRAGVRAFAAGAPPPRTVVRSWTGPD
jgi:AcrR family transcriptional regulator